MTHATSITGFASLQDAAEEIGRMRYDALAKFLWYLTEEMIRQQDNDYKAGKIKLANRHIQPIRMLAEARGEFEEMFDDFKKYMQDELDADDGSSL